MYAPIYGPKAVECTNFVKIVQKKGVPQGSVISPLICNIVLDGLENYVLNSLSYQYFFNSEEIKSISNEFENVKLQQVNCFQKYFKNKVKVYRYVDVVLIIGKGSYEQFLGISKRLVVFLAERGLIIKLSEDFVQIFCPGASFKYLGFQFQFANFNDSKINKGKYTRYCATNFFSVIRNFHFTKFYSGLLIIIRGKSYKYILLSFRCLFMRNKILFPVEILIKKYNKWLNSVVNYFGLN